MDMHASKQARELLDPDRATNEELEEALVRWDELPLDTLERLAIHPRSGPRLRTLQLADAWLREQGRSERPPAIALCPDAEELYDYGRGPGAEPLPARRRAELDRHVLACGACRELADSLASRPPAPLELGDAVKRPIAPARPVTPSLPPLLELAEHRARHRIRIVAPLAAAILVAAAAILFDPDRAPELGRGLPSAPLLRGSEVDLLVSPRAAVFAVSRAGGWHGLAPRPAPLFELAPAPDATEHRVELRRRADGALASGELVATLVLRSSDQSAEPFLAASGPPLEPGRYTWRAFALVRGLDRELGAHDFEVCVDAELELALERLSSAEEPARTEAAVRLLDARGYLADARSLARHLPESAEREAYLGRAPGR